MKNYILAVVAVVLVISVCVLVIHYEAEQTRESMRQVARDELPNLVQDGLDDTLRAPAGKVEKAEEKSEGLLDTLKTTVGVGKGSKGEPDSTDAPNGGKKEPSPHTSGPDGLLGHVRDTLGLPPDKSGKPQPTKPAEVVEGLFGVARDVIKSGELTAQPYVQLSIDEERTWGRRLHDEIVRESGVFNDSALHDRIDDLVAPLLRARRRRGIDYTFTVLKSDPEDINAFSIVGGYIYLNRGLIDFVKTDQELQFVLGHEIGHVDIGHCAQQLAYVVRAEEFATPIGGTVVAIVHGLLTRSYSQEQEYEADEYGFRAVIAAGQTRDQALDFPRRFSKYLKLRGDDQPAKKKSNRTAVGTFAQEVNDHFRSHPYMDDRIKRLEAIRIDSEPSK